METECIKVDPEQEYYQMEPEWIQMESQWIRMGPE